MTRARILLVGNPNTGKTTLYNRLTGGSQKVGNYPGVTVDRHVGTLQLGDGEPVELVDLPGAYSLAAESMDERIAFDELAGLDGGDPDVVLIVADGTQLERSLYFVLQILDLGLPTVLALNFSDEWNEPFDCEALSRALGIPVLTVSARKNTGLDELRKALAGTLAQLHTSSRPWSDGDSAQQEQLEVVARALPDSWRPTGTRRTALARWAALSLGEDELTDIPDALREAVKAAAIPDEDLIAPRYGWIERTLAELRAAPVSTVRPTSDRVDRFLLHPILGLFVFLGLMAVLFQALFVWADPMIGWVEGVVEAFAGFVSARLPDGLFHDFIIEGVIAGVGGVVVFLPQIILLFLALGILEDSGYMSRIVALMDRAMKSVGLEGRAFVPMLSGLACAIPAIMATRTMDRHRDRMLTMMVVPLMACAARLPVYGLLIAATIPSESIGGFGQGLLLVAMYLFGVLITLAATFVLGKTVLKGTPSKLVVEMPPYRIPDFVTVIRRTWSKCVVFLMEAGTVILACTIIMWVLLSFPKHELSDTAQPGANTEIVVASQQIRDSYAGQIGRSMEPVLVPLGFDWRIGIGLLGAFAAREVFVSTMGVVYGIEGADDDPTPLRESLTSSTWPDGRPVFTPLVCLSLLIFFAIACQCMSTLAVVKRETNTWRWPAFMFVYMTLLAWFMSFAVYQGGVLLGFG